MEPEFKEGHFLLSDGRAKIQYRAWIAKDINEEFSLIKGSYKASYNRSMRALSESPIFLETIAGEKIAVTVTSGGPEGGTFDLGASDDAMKKLGISETT